jgi:LysR family transcriptional regulator, benzoate and cis,cis-muconate-responsive activator of ben and cat genes
MPAAYSLPALANVVAVAEHGSLSEAARRLHMTQPTLSRQIAALERRVGVPLFERRAGGAVPTAAGEAFARRAGSVLREAELIEADVRLAATGQIGRLVVAFAGSAVNGPLGRALARCRRELPGIELVLVEEFDDELLTDGVRDGHFDIAVQRLPVVDPALATEALAPEPLSVFLAADHPQARGSGSLPVEALKDMPLVLWPRGSAPSAYDEVFAVCRAHGVTPTVAAVGRTVQTILALVAAGFGASVMADSYRVLQRRGVAVRPLAGVTTTQHVVWRAEDAGAALERFRAIMRAGATARRRRPS